ncbi:hypothetical protein OSB04_016774 [Centaurea solstitialis]|uniref:Retrotransposon protein, putative, Ty1-copia subclass n=1 Tax=Centaurea solstitialis TaxID=347529 RepID=A0AA38T395_9ASTR|nr:hypothetical protein OSB04_016774 [Centaurea solstitialis]
MRVVERGAGNSWIWIGMRDEPEVQEMLELQPQPQQQYDEAGPSGSHQTQRSFDWKNQAMLGFFTHLAPEYRPSPPLQYTVWPPQDPSPPGFGGSCAKKWKKRGGGSRYQQNPGEAHWVAVKNILKYLRRTKEMFLVFGGSEDEISVTGYTNARFQTDRDDFRSQPWYSSKQDTIADSTTEAKYIAASDAAKEAVWLRNFIMDLRVVASISRPVDIYYDNSGAVAQAKEPREHRKSKHVLRKFHLIREIIGRGDVRICKIRTDDNVQIR